MYLVGYENGLFRKYRTPDEEQIWRNDQEMLAARIVASGDFEGCARIQYKTVDNVDYRIVCENNIALNKALATLDLLWCEKLDDYLVSKESCERQIMSQRMVREKDLRVCASISTKELKNECEVSYWIQKAITEKNISLCVKVPQGARSYCEDMFWIEQLAVNPGAVRCDSLSANLKLDCEAIKLVMRDSSQKMQLCGRILNIRLQSICQSR